MEENYEYLLFIRHRAAPDSLLSALSTAVEKRITEHGVEQFVVGTYGRFDSLAAQAVRREKKQHPDILLFLSLPGTQSAMRGN